MANSNRNEPQSALNQTLGAVTPLPQQFQTSPDCWKVTWHQTANSLQTLFTNFNEADNQNTYRRQAASPAKPVLRPHFRSQVDVETGLVEIMFESEQFKLEDTLIPSAFILFTPYQAGTACPPLIANLQWGSYSASEPIVDDAVTFPALNLSNMCLDLENIESCLEFQLLTVH